MSVISDIPLINLNQSLLQNTFDICLFASKIKLSKNFGSKIKGMIFDFDGVIANFETRFIWPFLNSLKSLRLDFTPKEIVTSLNEFNTMIMDPNLNFWRITKSIFALTKKLGLNTFQSFKFLLRFGFSYKNNPYKIVPIIGAKEIIREIKNEGYQLILVTNSNRKTIEKAKCILPELHDFNIIITRSDVTKAKPNPEGFLKALEQLNLNTNEVISIGDQVSDIVVAKSLGIYHIALASYYPEYLIPNLLEYNPDLIIEDLTELLDYLSPLNSLEKQKSDDISSFLIAQCYEVV
ncbi:MAG: HAD family hydrolase [Candidatus Heimdallarchaeota archaeon]|nr:HAD family hydrolase [Candidatus Heimdallarchaeota archaeon]